MQTNGYVPPAAPGETHGSQASLGSMQASLATDQAGMGRARGPTAQRLESRAAHWEEHAPAWLTPAVHPCSQHSGCSAQPRPQQSGAAGSNRQQPTGLAQNGCRARQATRQQPSAGLMKPTSGADATVSKVSETRHHPPGSMSPPSTSANTRGWPAETGLPADRRPCSRLQGSSAQQDHH